MPSIYAARVALKEQSMSANPRKKFSPNINIQLVSEVSSACPKCGRPLMYSKSKTLNKQYEIAHIYPLNPTPSEVLLLANEFRLGADVDHLDNLIALCLICHNKFDNPRTVEEYREMVKLKQSIIEHNRQAKLMDDHQIEAEISKIIDALEKETGGHADLSLDPKELDAKINETMSRLTASRIKQNVSGYFSFVRKKLQLLEAESPSASTILSVQVKSFYLQQAKVSSDQQAIFKNIVEWIRRRSNSSSSEASEIIASFYIQNCEIFE